MSVHQSVGYRPYRKYPDTPLLRIPPGWERWAELHRIAPLLEAMHRPRVLTDRPPPTPIEDREFLKLAACWANPSRREALRALMLDLLKDDIADIMIAVLKRRNA